VCRRTPKEVGEFECDPRCAFLTKVGTCGNTEGLLCAPWDRKDNKQVYFELKEQ